MNRTALAERPAVQASTPAPSGGEIIERVIAAGDLSKLTPTDRSRYYVEVCRSVGLNPLTQPFEYIILNNKLTLYAKKSCTDQLRTLHGVSIEITGRERMDDLYVVTATATNSDGRKDSEIGAVSVGQLRGEALANAMMKATTKAKRRVTLSICGLGLLDESEVESIPGASRQPVPVVSDAGGGEGTIEIDFTDDDVFLFHWDELAEKRGLDQRTGREVLGGMIRKRKLDFFQTTAAQRIELLDGLGKATDEQVAQLKAKAQQPRNSNGKQPEESPAKSNADPAPQHVDTSESQDDGKAAADVDEAHGAADQADGPVTEDEVKEYEDFMELMVDAGARRKHTADTVLQAVSRHAKLLGREPEQLSRNARIGLVLAMRGGYLNLETGKVGRVPKKAS